MSTNQPPTKRCTLREARSLLAERGITHKTVAEETKTYTRDPYKRPTVTDVLSGRYQSGLGRAIIIKTIEGLLDVEITGV